MEFKYKLSASLMCLSATKLRLMLCRTLLLLMILVPGYKANSQVRLKNEIHLVDFNQLEPYLQKSNDTLYLINFWATWCAPCIKELPVIQKVEEKYRNEKFKVLLVSLDFQKDLESRLEPFLNSRNITSTVFLLNDPDQNRWIDAVDSNWSGEIPFTLIYGKHNRESYSHSFNFEELDSIINQKLKNP